MDCQARGTKVRFIHHRVGLYQSIHQRKSEDQYVYLLVYIHRAEIPVYMVYRNFLSESP